MVNKNILFKTICVILIIAFSFENALWANPEIFREGYPSSTLQVPSFFKPIPASTYENVLRANLIRVLKYFPDFEDEDFDPRLLIRDASGITVRLDFSSKRKEERNWVIPCSLTSTRSVRLYEAVVSTEGDLVELKPSSPREEKPAPVPDEEEPLERPSTPASESSGEDFQDKAIALEDFLGGHSLPSHQVSDGTIYMGSPFSALIAGFDELQEYFGNLRGKSLLDFGAGDLRVSLVATNLYGMKAAAVEKDSSMSDIAGERYNDALEQGFADRDDLRLLTNEDGFELSWRDFDIVFFFYTQPAGKKGEEFRRRLQDKAKELKPGSVLAILFTTRQVAVNEDSFPALRPILPYQKELYAGRSPLYLQLYQYNKPVPETNAAGPDNTGQGKNPGSPLVSALIEEIERFSEPLPAESIEARRRRLIICYDKVLQLLNLKKMLEGYVIYPTSGFDILIDRYCRAVFINREDLRDNIPEFIRRYTDWPAGGRDFMKNFLVGDARDTRIYKPYEGQKTIIIKGLADSTGIPVDNFLSVLDEEILQPGDRVIFLWSKDAKAGAGCLLEKGYRIEDDWLAQEERARLKAVLEEKIGTRKQFVSTRHYRLYFFIPDSILILKKTSGENPAAAERVKVLPGKIKNPESDWPEIFGNNNPIYLEMGCGDSTWIVEKARRHPDRNYVTIKIRENAGQQIMDARLPNLKIVYGDAKILTRELFAPGQLEEIYFNFPDMFLLALSTQDVSFGQDLFETLGDGKKIRIVTENRTYANDFLMPLLTAVFENQKRPILTKDIPQDLPLSSGRHKAKAYLEFTKLPKPASEFPGGLYFTEKKFEDPLPAWKNFVENQEDFLSIPYEDLRCLRDVFLEREKESYRQVVIDNICKRLYGFSRSRGDVSLIITAIKNIFERGTREQKIFIGNILDNLLRRHELKKVNLRVVVADLKGAQSIRYRDSFSPYGSIQINVALDADFVKSLRAILNLWRKPEKREILKERYGFSEQDLKDIVSQLILERLLIHELTHTEDAANMRKEEERVMGIERQFFELSPDINGTIDEFFAYLKRYKSQARLYRKIGAPRRYKALRENKIGNFLDSLPETYPDKRPGQAMPMSDYPKKAQPPKPAEEIEVLDIGSGSGLGFWRSSASHKNIKRIIRERTAEKGKSVNVRIIGIDNDRYHVDEGNARGLDIRNIDARKKTNLPSGSFDIITCFNPGITEFVESFIQEVKRLLKPGGEFWVSPWQSNFIADYEKILKRNLFYTEIIERHGVKIIIGRLDNSEERHRKIEALRCLGYVTDPKLIKDTIIPMVEGMTEDRDAAVRIHAEWILSFLRNRLKKPGLPVPKKPRTHRTGLAISELFIFPLILLVSLFAKSRKVGPSSGKRKKTPKKLPETSLDAQPPKPELDRPAHPDVRQPRDYHGKIIVIGGSAGGYRALMEIIKRFPEDHPPVVVCEHLRLKAADYFKRFMNNSWRNIIHGDEIDMPDSGTADFYLRKGLILVGRHVRIEKDSNGYPVVRMHREPDKSPVQALEEGIQHTVTIDNLFTSAAEIFGQNTVCVTISGKGRDGVRGARRVNEAGGVVLVQKILRGDDSYRNALPAGVAGAGVSPKRAGIKYMAALIMEQSRKSPPGPESPESLLARKPDSSLAELINELSDTPPVSQEKIEPPPSTVTPGSLKGVFEYLCENNIIDESGALLGEEIAKALDCSYSTIEPDLRGLCYHLHLIEKRETNKTGRNARYYVPESVRKKKNELLSILTRFRGRLLRPNATYLDRVYEEEIKPILEPPATSRRPGGQNTEGRDGKSTASQVFDSPQRVATYERWYDEEGRNAYLSELQALRAALPSEGRGLEIGVGTGRFAAELADENREIIGIDLSHEMLKRARERGVSVVLGKGENLPFAESEFDFCLIVFALPFFDDAKKVIEEARRVLKADGKIILGIIDKESDWFTISSAKYAEGKEKLYSAKEAVDLLETCGFANVSSQQTIFDYPEYLEKVHPVKEGFGEGIFVVLNAEKKPTLEEGLSRRILELSKGHGLSKNARKNLEDILTDPRANNIKMALLELLERGVFTALRKLGEYKEDQKAAKLGFMGKLVQAVSCRRRIRCSEVSEISKRTRSAEIDFVLEVDKNNIPREESQVYNLPDGFYLGEGKVYTSGGLEDILNLMLKKKLPGYIERAKNLRKGGKEISGIIFAVGGTIANMNPEEFRKVLIEIEENNEDLIRAGLKLYLYLVPEAIYEEAPRTVLSEKEKKFIVDIMKVAEESEGISPETIGECYGVLEKAVMLFGLEPTRMRLYERTKDKIRILIGKKVEIERYVECILLLKEDIAKVEQKTVFRMQSKFISDEVEHPFFPGVKLYRVKNPVMRQRHFTLGQKGWGAFEMFITRDGSAIYVTPAINDDLQTRPREYFCLNMDVGEPNALVYYYNGREIALDTVIPAASLGEEKSVNMARIIGILRESVAFREEVCKNPEANYYWMDKFHDGGMHVVSYDILAAHRKPHPIEFVGASVKLPDFYATDSEGNLALLAEFGRHRPNKLADKFATGYCLLVGHGYAQGKSGASLNVAAELKLSLSMTDRDIKKGKAFAENARKLTRRFLKGLKKSPAPWAIMVEDSYANLRMSFQINPASKKITGETEPEKFDTISKRRFHALMFDSEEIIVRRTGMRNISGIRPSRLLEYGYAKIVSGDGHIVIAPVAGRIQKPLARNWLMDLPFTTRSVPFEYADAREQELINYILNTNVVFADVDHKTAADYIDRFDVFLQDHHLSITDGISDYCVKDILSDRAAVLSESDGIGWMAFPDKTEERAYFFVLIKGDKIIGHGRFRIAPGYTDKIQFMFYLAPEARKKKDTSGKKLLKIILANIYNRFERDVIMFEIPKMSRYKSGSKTPRPGGRYEEIIANGTPAFFVKFGFEPAYLLIKPWQRARMQEAVAFARSYRRGEETFMSIMSRYYNTVIAEAPLILSLSLNKQIRASTTAEGVTTERSAPAGEGVEWNLINGELLQFDGKDTPNAEAAAKEELEIEAFFRDLTNPEELTKSMKETIVSILLSGKPNALAFSRRLTGYSEQHKTFIKQLKAWKERMKVKYPKFAKRIEDLIIIDFDTREELERKLEEAGLSDLGDEEKSFIFTFAPKSEEASLEGMGAAVRHVYIKEEGNFSPEYYYPLMDIVAISMLKAHLGYKKADIYAIFEGLGINREKVENRMNIKDINDDNPGVLIFTIIPRAKRYDPEDRFDRNARLLQFIRSA